MLRNGKDTAEVFEADAPRNPMSESARDSAFEAAVSQQPEQWRAALRKSAKKDDLPTVWPAWTHIASDHRGHLWVSLPGERGEVTRVVVFGTDGRLLGDVPPPSPKMFDLPAWNRDGLAFLDEDADGRTVIRVFRLVTTPEM